MPRRKVVKKTGASLDQLLAQADQRAASAGVEIEPEMYSLDWYRVGWPARKRIFLEREIKIRDAFDRNKLKSLKLNDAQQELLAASIEASADTSLEDFTLKCRRLGISTYYTADYLSDAIMESGHHVRLVAQDPDTLRALFKAVKEMYGNLRDEIRPNKKYSTKAELEFDDEEKGVTGSRITVSAVVPGQEEKGRGDTITRLHLTEIPFWRGDPETAATALCDATKGGKISGESTAKGVGDWFHRKYTQGKSRQGGTRAHFFEWWWNRNYRIEGARFVQNGDLNWFLLSPKQQLEELDDAGFNAARVTSYTREEREQQSLPLQSERDCAEAILAHLKINGYVHADAAWHCDEVAACLAWRRQEIAKKGAKKFRVEYPENDVDPFAQTGGTVFDQSYTIVKCDPRAVVPGHQYVVSLDPSMGIEGADPAAIAVIDRNTGEHVHRWSGYAKQDAQAKMVCECSDRYNDAEIVIESNMGEAAILEVERLGYGHRLYKAIDVQTQRDIDQGKTKIQEALLRARPGVAMTDRLKRLVIGLLEKAWREGEFRTCSQELCEEARVFIQNGDRMEAKSGYHDDEIIAVALAWYVIVTSYVGKIEFKSTGVKMGSALAGAY
ncbi:MAG: hypothetical protein DMF64_18965 [Acidobacteria bacterium]|nr:MAG: hypothetical protein DMF64_18965 [Acidobacteriota bacterium]